MLLNTGPGVGLQISQYLYPSELANAPADIASNYETLNAGDQLPIPSGRYIVTLGNYCMLEYLDPVTGVWRISPQSAARGQQQVVYSDGFTRRIANRLGCPVGAVIAGGGTLYPSTTTITASVGGSTWQAVVGGALSIVSVAAAGSGYTEAPLVFIPAPPAPGIQATGYATIASGTVASVSLVNFGAGYTALPPVQLLPNPTDINFGSIVQARVSIALAGAGAITGALCTNPGAPLATLTALTLTASGGAGSGATITPVILQTVTATSIVAGGVGMGSVADPALITSVGGLPVSVAAAGLSDPLIDMSGFIPRAFIGSGTANAGGTITALSIIDGGLFVGAPTPVVVPGAGGQAFTSIAVAPSITFTMGSTFDSVLIQPL